jgi:hypothetical protein
VEIVVIPKIIKRMEKIVSVLFRNKLKTKMKTSIVNVLHSYPYMPPGTNGQVMDFISIREVEDAIESMRGIAVEFDTTYLDLLGQMERRVQDCLNDIQELQRRLTVTGNQ